MSNVLLYWAIIGRQLEHASKEILAMKKFVFGVVGLVLTGVILAAGLGLFWRFGSTNYLLTGVPGPELSSGKRQVSNRADDEAGRF